MFSDWLQDQMDAAGMTQDALAVAAGVRQQTVSLWLANRRRPGKSVPKLASALGVTTDEIYDHMKDESPSPAAEGDRALTSGELLQRIAALEAEVAEMKRAAAPPQEPRS